MDLSRKIEKAMGLSKRCNEIFTSSEGRLREMEECASISCALESPFLLEARLREMRVLSFLST